VISSGSGNALTDQFAGLPSTSGFLPLGYNSNHMAKKRPDGGNILFMDGHVEWRRFQNMKPWADWVSKSYYYWF
jgi:prepilin-type processing-associated H-X9-DG protein